MSFGTVVPATAEEAVANGAQFLDQELPGWWKAINLETLNLEDCGTCVCGQLARAYRGALSEDMSEFLHSFDEDHGFDCKLDWTKPVGVLWGYQALDVEWEKVIRARLEADVPSKEKPRRKEKVTA